MERDTMTQNEKFSEILKTLRPDVTEYDRKMAEKNFDVSGPTITRYLQGNSPNNDLASQLIIFFRQLIQKRDKALNQ